MTADQILQKHEDANEMHFHQVDREFIIQAMKEYATSSQTEISDEEIEKAAVDILKKENKEGIYFREDMERIIEGAKWYREQIKSKI